MSSRTSSWAIVGAAGYTAAELFRLLLNHPHARVTRAVSRSSAGRRVSDVHPHLRGLCDLELSSTLGDLADLDGVFFCVPHGQAVERVAELLAKRPDIAVIDLSADFRLRDRSLYPKWYGRRHEAPELLETFVYGLPELNREALSGARRIANPGCFATAITLALAPFARVGLTGQASVTAVTGSSGSGARHSPRTHHPTRAATMRAYRVLGHQHTPEILQVLGGKLELAFVPISGPFVRGIYATCQVELPDTWESAHVPELFDELYADAPFVRVLDAPPDLQVVTGSNFCDLHLVMAEGRIAVISAIDNLLKGAAGQAVQNMNLAMGWSEDAGLRVTGGYP